MSEVNAEIASWNARFARADYLFGTAPNRFLAEHAGRLPQGGEVLCVADGEGRNGAFLAGRGFRVTAFDGSQVGTEKALALDAGSGVAVQRVVAAVEEWTWEPARYDAVVAIFIQFAPPPLRARMFAGMMETLRPGGVLLMEGYTPRQLQFGTGGPPFAENMYTVALLRDAFGSWDVELLVEYDDDVDEGPGHTGRSALIDLIAVKPAESDG